MADDLKKQNYQPTFYILAAVLIVSLGFQNGLAPSLDWAELFIGGALCPVIAAVLLMLTQLISPNVKHKLVFTRFRNEMPGSRCHKLCQSEPRLDLAAAAAKWPHVFSELTPGKKRNALWYSKIYKQVKDEAEVLQAHRSFLLYRDVLAGLFVLLVPCVIWYFWGASTVLGPLNPAVFAVLGGAIALVMTSARWNGNRMVVNAVVAAL